MKNNAKKVKSAASISAISIQQQSSTNNNWQSPSDNSSMY
jgi:hypothetical protein